MNFDDELAKVLRSFDVLAARSLSDLVDLMQRHGATAREIETELALRREEIEAERRHVAQDFWRQMREWNGWNESGGGLH